MPGSILNADINFPHFTGRETADQKIDVITNYLYLLYEQLRYTMGNLGAENFSAAGKQEITELYAADSGGSAGLKVSPDEILARVEDLYGNYSQLKIRSDGISAKVENIDGRVTTVEQDADGLESRVSAIDETGGALDQLSSRITQTATEIRTEVSADVSTLDGKISTVSSNLTQTAGEIRASVSTVSGVANTALANAAILDISVTGIRTRVSNVEDDVTTLEQTATQIQTTVQSHTGSINTITQTLDGVVFQDSDTGTTVIDGSYITTGTINAERLNLTGSITWDDLTAAAKDRVDAGKGGATYDYLHQSYISRIKIASPKLIGGQLYATGLGDSAGQSAAFYISDGVTGSGETLQANDPLGWLSYDDGGVLPDNPHRVFLHTEDGIALKIESGGNMSIEANDNIYLESNLVLKQDVNFGYTLPDSGINGQLFFKLPST